MRLVDYKNIPQLLATYTRGDFFGFVDVSGFISFRVFGFVGVYTKKIFGFLAVYTGRQLREHSR